MAIYFPFRNTSFNIDDPDALAIFGNENLSINARIFETVWSGRWRPLTWAYYTFAFELFHGDFFKWWLLAIFILSLIILLFCKILNELKIEKWIIFTLSVILTSSRFIMGIPLNITFAGESLGALLLLSMFYFWQNFVKTLNFNYVYLAINSWVLATLAHERFIFVALWLVVITLLGRTISRGRQFALCGVVGLITFLFLFGKNLYLGIPLLLGTGSATALGFSISSLLSFIFQLILGVLGVNLGESYLAGYTWNIQNLASRGVSIFLLVISLNLLVKSLKTSFRERNSKSDSKFGLESNLSLALLFLVFSGPPVMTIRLEQRWLFLPFAVFLIIVSRSFTRPEGGTVQAKRRKKAQQFAPSVSQKNKVSRLRLAIVLFASVNLLLNFQYVHSIDKIYFRWNQVSFENSLEAIVEANTTAKQTNKIVIILHKNENLEYLKILQNNMNLKFKKSGVKYLTTDSLASYENLLDESPILMFDDFILKSLDLKEKNNRIQTLGEKWDDGWAGKSFQVLLVDPRCKSLEIIYIADWKNSVTLSDNFGNSLIEQINVGAETKFYPLSPLSKYVNFEFDETRELNRENGETRVFSTKIEANCFID